MKRTLATSILFLLTLAALHAATGPTLSLTDPSKVTINWPEWNGSCYPAGPCWQFGMPAHPDGNGSQVWLDLPASGTCGMLDASTEVPTYDECAAHALRFPYKGSVATKSQLSATFQTLDMGGATGTNCQVWWMGPFPGAIPESGRLYGYPCEGRVSFVLWKDDRSDYGRWYSYGRVMASLSAFGVVQTMTADLNDPAIWSSVYWHMANSSAAALKGFNAAKAHLAEIHLAFSGGDFAEHGANSVGGPVRFELRDIRLQ